MIGAFWRRGVEGGRKDSREHNKTQLCCLFPACVITGSPGFDSCSASSLPSLSLAVINRLSPLVKAVFCHATMLSSSCSFLSAIEVTVISCLGKTSASPQGFLKAELLLPWASIACACWVTALLMQPFWTASPLHPWVSKGNVKGCSCQQAFWGEAGKTLNVFLQSLQEAWCVR